MKNKKLEELLKQNKYDVLQYMLKTDLKSEFDKKEVYELYKYVFSVTEKANSICDPLQITEKELLDIIDVIGNTLQNKDIDFNELAIKQEGTELQFINRRGKILNSYKMEVVLDDTRYQPSNIEYAKENIKYRENRLKEMQKFGTHLIRIFVENEELFLEKAKERLHIMKYEIYERKNNKIGGINNMLSYKILSAKDNMKKELINMDDINDEIKTDILQIIEKFFNRIDSEKILKDMEWEWARFIAEEVAIESYDEVQEGTFDFIYVFSDSIDFEAILDNMEVEWIKYIDDKSKINTDLILEYIANCYRNYIDDETEEKLCGILKEVLPQELFSDEKFVLKLIQIFQEEHWESSRGTDCKSIIFCKLFDYIKDNMDPKFRNDLEFLDKINDITKILFFSDELKSDKQLMLKLMEEDPDYYICMNKEFKIDDDIVTKLIDSIDEDGYEDFKWTLKNANIFGDNEIIQLAKQDENEHKEFLNLYRTILKEEIGNSIEKNNKIVTHFGDDLDNKSAIYALQKWAEDNDYVKIGHPIEIVRVPAGQVKQDFLNIDTGGHRGNKVNGKTIVIDGDIENGVKSASEALSKLGIYVPEQIVELADTKPNKVSSLDSRSGLALVRYLNGEQLFKLAEAGLLDKSLSYEQLEEFGLVNAHKKQEKIINTAIEKVNKYTKEWENGEKIVLASEQILAGSSIAYEMGINYYASASTHFNQKGESDGVTFAITSKPGVRLPEDVLEFGSELVQKYRIDENTSGVFVSPNGQMIVAGGLKNPEFKIENETIEGMLEKIENKFTGKDINTQAVNHRISEVTQTISDRTTSKLNNIISEISSEIKTKEDQQTKDSK